MVHSEIENYGILPEIRIDDARCAVSVAQALRSAGLNLAKITGETKETEKAARNISAAFPDMLLFADALDITDIKVLHIDEADIHGGHFDKIRDFAAGAVRQMLGFDLAHVVINCENSEQAERDSGKIESIFGFERTDAGATFSNAGILHFTKQKSYGKNGQIAIRSNCIERAIFYLRQNGRDFIEESARYDEEGRLTSIYLDNIIGGFAIKLVRS